MARALRANMMGIGDGKYLYREEGVCVRREPMITRSPKKVSGV